MKNAILNGIKQNLINAKAGDTVTVKFQNGSMNCHLLASNDGYYVIYDSTVDRVIIAWALRLYSENNKVCGEWGNGYYFDKNNNADNTIDRYNLKDVVETYIKKGFRE